MSIRKGKFIVIDGTDGSGKATQTQLLINALQKENIAVKSISFPRYGEKSCGPVEQYLSGKYGSADEVDAKVASILYAIDRYDASFEIKKDLNSGINVIADRYVGSNLGHQGSKIPDKQERLKFYNWNRNLEYDLLNIPKPDINIILHVPTKITLQLANKRGGWKADIATDIHETNINHLKQAEKTYLELANLFPEFHLIECAPNGKLLSIQSIHNKIMTIVHNLINS
ncbi:thymidylate kinase [Candidatus Parcubacteria bacterium]|nr:MAG: thymidylate kinase [Candidatus Parcubacteria bacterium]